MTSSAGSRAATSAGRLQRVELVLAAAGLALALIALVVGIDAIRFHLGATLEAVVAGDLASLHLGGVALLAIATIDVVALALAGRSIARQLRGQRAFVRALPVVDVRVFDSLEVSVVADSIPRAFCAGILRPRVYLSTAALDLLDDAERAAVLAHEAHHARRRDPLRLLVSRAISDALVFVPRLAALGQRQRELAELAADAAAVSHVGSPAPLASALLTFEGSGAPEVVGISPERVDQLLGRAAPDEVRRPLLIATTGVVASLAAVGVASVVTSGHAELGLPLSAAPLCTVALVLATTMLASPGLWLLRRVARRITH